MVLSLLGDTFVEVLRELTLDDRLARLKGVAEPLRPFTALTVFLTLDEARDGVPEDLVTLCLRLLVLLGGVGVGDREVALEEAGVDNLDRDELGVSERSGTSGTYLGFCTPGTTEELLFIDSFELVGFGAPGVSCCSESIRRCVLERRLELVRPDMVWQVNAKKCVSFVASFSKS